MLYYLTLVHVLISLAGIAAGFVVLWGFLKDKPLPRWTAAFLATTIATSATGYLFPFTQLLPSHIIGALSLVLLALAVHALYQRKLAGRWRKTYVITATAALYFNVFVLIVQLFLKVPFLNALAPTQAEPPFALAQFLNLVLFAYLGFRAVKRFHSGPAALR
jgi:hypothetical protein